MNILHSFSHTDLALELKDELEESCEREQFFEGITVSHKEIGKKGLKPERNSLGSHREFI